MNLAEKLHSAQYVVVKIGSALIVNEKNGKLREKWLKTLVEELAGLHRQNKKIVIVCSGAIAIGKYTLGIKTKNRIKLEENQAAASVGQIILADYWRKLFKKHNIIVAQILLTIDETEKRKRYLNTHNTFDTLHNFSVIPIVNENDSVATFDIRYGDNDRLAARVATMLNADLLIMLSNVDGLYSESPLRNPKAEHFKLIDEVTPAIEAMAEVTKSQIGRGGMITKIQAAKIAMAQGCDMILGDGKASYPISRMLDSGIATFFRASQDPKSARKNWIAGILNPKGQIYIDAGAVRALYNDKSLLPAGVTAIKGDFQCGDAVLIYDDANRAIASGIVAYSLQEITRIKGKKTADIEKILGYKGRITIVHRDDMVLLADKNKMMKKNILQKEKL